LLSKHLGKPPTIGGSADTGSDARRHWVRYP
jgi:hypothetical protein